MLKNKPELTLHTWVFFFDTSLSKLYWHKIYLSVFKASQVHSHTTRSLRAQRQFWRRILRNCKIITYLEGIYNVLLHTLFDLTWPLYQLYKVAEECGELFFSNSEIEAQTVYIDLARISWLFKDKDGI